MSTESLVRRGVSLPDANRMVVRANLREVLETSFACCGACWLVTVISLFVGFFCILCWAEAVYGAHSQGECDKPFGFMLRALLVCMALYALRSVVVRWALCYNAARDGPLQPCRVVLFKRVLLLGFVAWPIVSEYFLLTSDESRCRDLKVVIQALVVYCYVMASFVVIMPLVVMSAVFFCLRHGLLSVSSRAAPESLIESFRVVPFDAVKFDDVSLPASCCVCLDAFSSRDTIVESPCQSSETFPHIFHKTCLAGWLQVERTCPLCRVDLTESAVELS